MRQLHFGQIDEQSALGGSIAYQFPDGRLDLCLRPVGAKAVDHLIDRAHVAVGPESVAGPLRSPAKVGKDWRRACRYSQFWWRRSDRFASVPIQYTPPLNRASRRAASALTIAGP